MPAAHLGARGTVLNSPPAIAPYLGNSDVICRTRRLVIQ